jgi:hypothetical protein
MLWFYRVARQCCATTKQSLDSWHTRHDKPVGGSPCEYSSQPCASTVMMMGHADGSDIMSARATQDKRMIRLRGKGKVMSEFHDQSDPIKRYTTKESNRRGIARVIIARKEKTKGGETPAVACPKPSTLFRTSHPSKPTALSRQLGA